MSHIPSRVFVAIALAACFAITCVASVRGNQARIQAPRDPKAPAAQTAGKSILAGVVVSADSGRPVRRARVSISGGTPRVSRTIQTDDQGGFRFTDLPAGEYSLSTSKGGFVETIYGQKKPGSGRPGTPVQLLAGQELNRLSLPLVKGGVITGTVFDETGEPMFGTRVRAYKWVMQSGERTLESAASAMTDDRGVYRMPALQAGEYVVSAMPGDGGDHYEVSGNFATTFDHDVEFSFSKLVVSIDRKLGETWVIRDGADLAETSPATGFATIYYPGTTQASAAVSIPVTPGEERAGVDFQLQAFPLSKVSGIVTGPEGPVAKAEVQLVDRSAPRGFGGQSTRTDKDGRFSFSSVQPGQYTAFARATPKGGKPLEANAREAAEFLAATKDEGKKKEIAGAMAAAAQLWALADISTDGRELNDVQLSLQQGMTISGQVVIEAGSGPSPNLTRMSMTVEQVGQHFTGDALEPPPAAVDANGRFTIRGVMPGRYRIAVAGGAPSGYVIKSAIFGGVDVLDTPFELTGSEQPAGGVVTFTTTTRATEVSGSVQDDASQPAAGVTVIAFAAEERFWAPESRRIVAVRPSSDGKYVLKGLPPGNYRLAAVTDVEPGQWFDPGYLRTLGVFTAFTVTDGAKVTHDIRVR